jgi:integrase
MRGVRLLREDNIQERILTREEIAKLLAACTEYSRPIVLTALHTGMRRGEILGLKWSQVDM